MDAQETPGTRRAGRLRMAVDRLRFEIAFRDSRAIGGFAKYCARRVLDLARRHLHRSRPQHADASDASLAPRPRLFPPARQVANGTALDHRIHNPIGWRRDVDQRVASLGPLDRLPSGALSRYALKSADRHIIALCHHLEDMRHFHASPAERAGALVRLSATGVPVHVLDDDAQIEALLGADLYRLVKTDIAGADTCAREMHSIRSRRAALRGHAADACARTMPSVSIILPTRRPNFLLRAAANIAKQDYPRLELVLALHGDGFREDEIGRAVATAACPVEIVRIAAEQSFVYLLNAATAAAGGDLVTKMDDDDLYDAHHIWDLALAHEYAAAHLVGKGLECVHLAARDLTVALDGGAPESYSPHLAGGTLMLARDDLRAIGGWQGDIPYEDRILIDNIARAGGRVYQTHGKGYLLMRHGDRHNWDVGDEYFLRRATEIHSGFRPSVAGIEEA